MKSIAAIMIVTVLLAVNAVAAFVEPTLEQINTAVDDPGQIAQLLAGATPEDAVRVVSEIIKEIVKRDLPEEEMKTKIALATAMLFRTMPDRALELAQLLSGKVPIEVLPTVVAAAAVVMGNQASVITEAFVSKLPRESAQVARNAGSHPETVLPAAVVLSLGVPVSHTTTVMGRQPTAMPVAPPLTITTGGQPTAAIPAAPSPAPAPVPAPRPPPPPVATNYAQ